MARAWLMVCLTTLLLPGPEAATAKRCPALASVSVDLQCWRKTDKVTSVNCSEPAAPDTTVTFKCREYHEGSPSGEARCGPAGAWSQPVPQCKPKCGTSNLDIVSPTSGLQEAKVGNFPWHAGVYNLRDGRFNQVCGGSLISPRAILTAAVCVSDHEMSGKQTPLNISDLGVSFGKMKRGWNKTEDTGLKRYVKAIHIHPHYRGRIANYHGDLAVLELMEEVSLSQAVLPVCMDQHNLNSQQLSSGQNLGYVPGWGPTTDCSVHSTSQDCPASDSLHFQRTLVQDFPACVDMINTLSQHQLSYVYLAADKYCGGNGSVSVVQKGDSGGGLVFVLDGKFYVYGIASVRLKTKEYTLAGFTSLSEYWPWINSIVAKIENSYNATINCPDDSLICPFFV